MNCRTARELVLAGEDSSLPDARLAALRVHLGSCSACARIRSQADLAGRWLQELPQAEPSANFEWRLKLRLAQLDRAVPGMSAPLPDRRRWAFPFVATTAAAALLVLAVGLYVMTRPGPALTPELVAQPSPGPWTPGQSQQSGVGWPRLVPVRAGAPLGPEVPHGEAASILGGSSPDMAGETGRRPADPVQTHPVRW